MIAQLNYDERKRELAFRLRALNPVLRDYLVKIQGLDIPKKPIGEDYQGDFTEEDSKRMNSRIKRYIQIKISLEDLCNRYGIVSTELDKAKVYAVEALGI